MKTIFSIITLAAALFAADPQILSYRVLTDSFKIMNLTPASDTVSVITWQGEALFSCLDTDADSLRVSVAVNIGSDTLAADSVWGAAKTTSGNDRRLFFKFRYPHHHWNGSATARVRLTLDDAALPAWRAAMAPNTWVAVSASTMADVDPAKNPLMNPNGITDAPWRGVSGHIAIIEAWGSAVWDDVNGRLWVPNGGGHGNYGGNEPYKMELDRDSPVWQLMRAPSGAIGNLLNLHDGQESTGVYADGRVRSTHTYNNVAFVPGVGPVIVRMGSAYPGSGGPSKVWKVDETTGEPVEVFNFETIRSSTINIGGNAGAAACYDPTRNRIYSIGNTSNVSVVYCTPSALPGTWSGGRLPNPVYLTSSNHRIEYLPVQDRIISLHGWSTPAFSLVHPVTGVQTEITVTGSYAAGFTGGEGTAGMVWSPELGKLLLWDNSSNEAQISTLTPVGDGLSQWVAGTLTVSLSNTVIPPSNSRLNGVYGLFGYSTKLKGCYYLPATNKPVYFYATE